LYVVAHQLFFGPAPENPSPPLIQAVQVPSPE
jgi:hypothetical protein